MMMRLRLLVFTSVVMLSACGQAPEKAEQDTVQTAETAEQTDVVDSSQNEDSETEPATALSAADTAQSYQAETEQKVKPTVSAGPARTVNEGSDVVLKAKVKNFSLKEIEYLWRQTSGEKVQMVDPRAADLRFIAPLVDKHGEELSFSVLAYNLKNESAKASVKVSVMPITGRPEVHAGEDVTVEESMPLILYGYGQAANGTGVDFKWSIEPPGLDNLVLEDVTDANATLIPPPLKRRKSVTIRLTVTDDNGLSAADFITVTIEPQPQPDVALADVVLTDPNLTACVAEQAEENLWYLTKDVKKLQCGERHIEDLSGLEYFSNLVWLDLSRNKIKNIDPLGGIPDLKFLRLGKNRIKDISSISQMSSLTFVDLSYNRIESMATLVPLPDLRLLFLSGNRIKDNQLLYRLSARDKSIKLDYKEIDCPMVADLENSTNIKLMRRDECER